MKQNVIQKVLHTYMYNYIIHMYSGITSGRVLDGQLLYTKILEVNLFAFAYRLFHRDFSPINGTYCSLWANANKLTSRIFVYMYNYITIHMYSGTIYIMLTNYAILHFLINI